MTFTVSVNVRLWHSPHYAMTAKVAQLCPHEISVWLSNDPSEKFDAKTLMSLMTLWIKNGDVLIFDIAGDDSKAEETARNLQMLFKTGFLQNDCERTVSNWVLLAKIGNEKNLLHLVLDNKSFADDLQLLAKLHQGPVETLVKQFAALLPPTDFTAEQTKYFSDALTTFLTSNPL